MAYRHTIIQDSREQSPFLFAPDWPVEVGTLKFGDYALKGFERRTLIERKSCADILGSLTPHVIRDKNGEPVLDAKGRQQPDDRYGYGRFQRELQAMSCFERPFIICECSYQEIADGNYRSMMNPAAVTARLFSIMARTNIKILFARDATQAAEFCMMIFEQFLKGIEKDARAIGFDRRARKPENNEFQSAASAEGEEG